MKSYTYLNTFLLGSRSHDEYLYPDDSFVLSASGECLLPDSASATSPSLVNMLRDIDVDDETGRDIGERQFLKSPC